MKLPHQDNNRILFSIIILSLVAVILLTLTFNPSSGSDFIMLLDEVRQTAIIITICFVVALSAYQIFSNRQSSGTYKKPP